MPVMSFEWKLVAEPVMQLYTESTDGSYIEYKESALVWHHRFADPDFGSWQAKEMQNHLESVLANEPVTVKSGAQIVEVMIGCGCGQFTSALICKNVHQVCVPCLYCHH
jgi:trehalose 6-phosphate synthase/phosphatase